VLEIKDNSDTQFRDSKIVQHQSTLMISNSVDHLGIHDNSIKCDQVGDKETDLVSFVEDIEQRLLAEGIFRIPNSTANAFSYGFSSNP
jgi:hypothetical protein